jgi:hypothetical protein
VQREEPVLAVQHAQDAVLLGDLQQPEIVLARHRREVKRFSEVMMTAPGIAGSVPPPCSRGSSATSSSILRRITGR